MGTNWHLRCHSRTTAAPVRSAPRYRLALAICRYQTLACALGRHSHRTKSDRSCQIWYQTASVDRRQWSAIGLASEWRQSRGYERISQIVDCWLDHSATKANATEASAFVFGQGIRL